MLYFIFIRLVEGYWLSAQDSFLMIYVAYFSAITQFFSCTRTYFRDIHTLGWKPKP